MYLVFNQSIGSGGIVSTSGMPSSINGIRYNKLQMGFPYQYHDNCPQYSGSGLDSPHPIIKSIKYKRGKKNEEYVIEYQ